VNRSHATVVHEVSPYPEAGRSPRDSVAEPFSEWCGDDRHLEGRLMAQGLTTATPVGRRPTERTAVPAALSPREKP
jgi:hypothetical protein